MIEIAPDVYYITGKNNYRFPYCACLYVRGKNMRVLIDAGMGSSHIQPLKKLGIDVLILSHCHIDHRLTRGEIAGVPVWCHKKEAPYLRDKELFLLATGIRRSGVDLMSLFDSANDLFDVKISRTLVDGEKIDLGGVTLVTFHTPGHSPGHLAFYIPEHELLFPADVDLTPSGPFYGHDFADIDDFIQSIRRLRKLNPKIVATGHAGPFEGDVSKYFDDYEEVISRRKRLVLEHLTQPRSLEYFTGRNLIFRSYPEDLHFMQWLERVHIESI
ncbi:MAG: MBL fold metallo-hydrolase [Planctomycetota bacterium]|jgi:glyoxylase-like metal-dependent hydrolase (beta-lactamase superfamily II)